MNDSWAIGRLVSQIKGEWRRGAQAPSAAEALAAHPELRRWKSIVLDLAYEEYQLRADQGQTPDADDFCRRFPDYQRSLLHRIEIERYLRGEEEQLAQAWPEPGDCFLGYRLLEQLGKGAVGRVFLAQQIEMRDRLVVVKIAPRAQREAHTLALLNHGAVVPVYRYDEDPASGLAGICMPYLSRTTLEDFLAAAQRQTWPPPGFTAPLQAMRTASPDGDATALPAVEQPRAAPRSYVYGVLDLARQMAEALAHTHSRGVLHLDLKPSNVLLLADGRPMLLDFNLSVEGAVGASVIGGTLPYMSPEQLQDAILGRSYASRPVDGRSDLFSLGVILYELLTGRHPFGEIPRLSDPREAAKELLRRHEQGPAPLPADVVFSPDVARFLDACLAQHPDQRPQTAEEAAATLRLLLSPRQRIRRWRRAHRKLLTVAGGAALAAVLALAAVASLTPPEHERWLEAAQTHIERGELADAEKALELSLAANPRFVEAWDHLGSVQRDMRRYRDAVASFERAWDATRDPRFFVEMGNCVFLERRYDLAERYYQNAMERGFKSAELFVGLAQCCHYSSRHDAAAIWYSQALNEDSQSATAYRGRANNEFARAMMDRDHIDDLALADIRKATELAPEGDVLFEAAMIYAAHPKRLENAAAIKDFLHRALRTDKKPQNIEKMAVFRDFRDAPWFRDLASPESSQ